jgi:hypothetical protein
MNSRSSSYSAHPQRRPSGPERRLSRRKSTVSSIEQGHHGASTDPAVHSITEEIAEIKRYEDFTTIDWVQDDAREQLRRRARRKENAGFFGRDGVLGWRRKLSDSYDAGQAWLVVTIVGVVIGLNAAALNIITEWLSDVKLGYCTTAFYLNEQFCCWGAENGCDEWRKWTSFGLANYIIYTIFSVSLSGFQIIELLLTHFPDPVRSCFCLSGQTIRPLCCRLGNIRDQMHHRRIRDAGFPGLLDLPDQVDLSTVCHCFRFVSRQRRSQRTLRCLCRQCHLAIL